VAPFFAGVLLSSMFALKDAPMSLIIVFRGLAPLFSLAIEMFYPSPYTLTPQTIFSLVALLLGIGLYLRNVESRHFGAIGWVLLNNFFAVGDRLLQRLMLSKDQWPVDISKSSCAVLNNLIGLIPMMIAAYLNGEYAPLPSVVKGLHRMDWIWLILSCVVGAGIAYTGIWTQSLTSATSFLVLATSNKFFILLIEVCVMQTSSMTLIQFTGATIVILSGVAYGKAREAAERAKIEDSEDTHETTPLVAGQKMC